jgi:hypothetical protein
LSSPPRTRLPLRSSPRCNADHNPGAVSGFSEDGQWWWDGTTWVATAQLVITDLPMTEFERSGKLEMARRRRKTTQWLDVANGYPPLAWLTGTALLIVGARAGRAYHAWTLEQLALATAYLLGPDEPMLAGSGGVLIANHDLPPYRRDLAVAVSAGHVLVFRFDSVDGQPRWIALAARSGDVKVEVLRGLRTTRDGIEVGPDLVVSGWNGKWTIHGASWFKPDPVQEAWRQSTKGTATRGSAGLG